MNDPVLQAIRNQAQALFPHRESALLAVSGGLDSMALLHAMHQLQSDWHWRLAISHVDHKTRNGDSAKDCKFVQQTAQQLGIPIDAHQWNCGTSRNSLKEGFEQAARNARLNFHAKSARKHRSTVVVMAHHQDDQAETFLWKLMRGAGGAGLAGMRPMADFPDQKNLKIVRPFLRLRKAELREYAEKHGVAYREDESNQNPTHVRNRIRINLLPAFSDAFKKSPIEAISQSQTLIGAEADFAMTAALDWLESRAKPFPELHIAVQRWVVGCQLHTMGIELNFKWLEHLRLRPNDSITIGREKAVFRDVGGRLNWHQVPDLDFRTDSYLLVPDNRWQQIDSNSTRVRFRVCRQKPVKMSGELFDADRIGESIQLRLWQPGDRFQPVGLGSAVKLQDLFTNAKVPAAAKRQKLVACTATDEIFWVEGLRIGEMAKIKPNTKRFLKWNCQKS